MNLKELKELIDFLIEKDIAEFELERGDVKVRIKRGGQPGATHETRYFAVPSAPPATAELAPVPAAAPPAAPSLRPKKRPPRKGCTSCVRPSSAPSTSLRRPVRRLS